MVGFALEDLFKICFLYVLLHADSGQNSPYLLLLINGKNQIYISSRRQAALSWLTVPHPYALDNSMNSWSY